MMPLFKNQSGQKVRVFAFADAGHASLDPGEPVTGDAAQISAKTALDNAALGTSNDTAPTEVSATDAPGVYEFDPTQAETNGSIIEWYAKSSTAGVQVITVGGSVQPLLPANFGALGIESDGDLTKVNTLNGHTAQTGDSYARLGAPAGASIAADIAAANADTDTLLTRLSSARAGYLDNLNIGEAVAGTSEAAANAADLATLLGRLSSARAGYLDNLNIGEAVASTSEVTAIQNNTKAVRVVPTMIERPDAGSDTWRIELMLYDDAGNMEAPDAAPTLTLVNQSGTDRSSMLDSTTMSLVATGHYRSILTVSSSDAIEQLVFTFSVIEGGSTRLYGNQAQVADTTAVDFTSADRTKLEAVHSKLPSKTYLAGTANSDGDVQLDEATGSISDLTALIATVGTAGAGLTDLGGMSTGMKAEIESEANDALVALKLDHLVAVADADDVVNNSIMAKIASASGDWSTFAPSMDALEAQANTMATEFSAIQATQFAHTSTLAAILDDTGTNGVALAAATLDAIAAALLDLADGVEAGLTLREHSRVVQAAVAGKSSGHTSGASTPAYRDKADTLNRITAVTDGNGNRTSVTLNVS